MTGAPEIGFQAATAATPPRLAAARAIYETSFPARQRDDFDTFTTAHPDRRDELILAGGDVAGVSFARALRAVPWRYLEYLAVDPARRGRAIGGAAWAHVRDAVRADGARGVVLEVEDPAEPGITDDERDVRERRIRFWTRCGFADLPVPDYVVPNLDGPGEERLILMAAPAGEALAELAAIVTAVFIEGYGLDRADPRIRDALRTAGRP